MQHNQMTAAEIHNLWNRNWNNQFFRDNYPPARKYYIEVRCAMYQELINNGNCKLIDQYLVKKEIQIILYCAMRDVLWTVSENKGLSEVSRDGLACGIKEFSWRYLSQNALNIVLDTAAREEMKRFYQKIQNACRDRRAKPLQTAGNEPIISSAWTPAAHQPGPDLAETARQCATMVEEAEKKRDSILQQANAQRDSILQRANAERESIENETNIKRSEMLENANREAERIIAEAKAEAEHIREEARRQAEDAANANAETLINRQLSSYMRRERSQWEEDRQALDNARTDMSTAVPTLKEDICNITTSAGAQINSGLDAMIEQLNAMKTDLLFSMNRWRSDLYKCEYGNLVNFYLSLVNMAAQFEKDVCLEQTKPMTEEQELTILQRHSSRTNNLLNTLVRAMEAMGIKPFTPQSGDIFDSYFHAVNDSEDPDFYNGRIIESCIAPGIQRVVNSQSTDVLHRATVQLHREDEHEE